MKYEKVKLKKTTPDLKNLIFHGSSILFIGKHESIRMLFELQRLHIKGLKIYDYRQSLSAKVAVRAGYGERIFSEEINDDAMKKQMYAGINNMEYIPCNVSDDLINKYPNIYKKIKSPFTQEMITVGKAIRPEVAIIHVPRCDIYGNIQVDPTDKIEEMENLRLALCASHIIVTAEQIVTSKAIQMNQRNMVMESDRIDFVMETPYGSFPTCEEGRYRADEMDDVQLLKVIEEYKDWERWINDIDVMKLLSLTTNRRGE